MRHGYVKRTLTIFVILFMVLINQPMKAHAYANLHRERGHGVEKSRDKHDHSRDGDKRDEHHDDHHG